MQMLSYRTMSRGLARDLGGVKRTRQTQIRGLRWANVHLLQGEEKKFT